MTEQDIISLWDKYGTPDEVREHCKAVCALATYYAENMGNVDQELVEDAALLHDIVRHRKNHEAEGAAILEAEGHPEIAWIVARHKDFPDTQWSAPLAAETALVYLADKQMKGTSMVSMDERFEASKEKIMLQEDREEALKAHEARYLQAKKLRKIFLGM